MDARSKAKAKASNSVMSIGYVLRNFKPEEMVSDGNTCILLEKTLKDIETKASVVISILQSLEQCLAVLNQDHKPLIKTIMNMDWLNSGSELIQVYHAFALNLLSAHSNYFKPFLVVLIKKMREEYKVSNEATEEEKLQSRLKMEQDFQHIHTLLQSLCRLIPMTTMVLVPLLEEIFPYINKGAAVFENYTCNLLKITSYIPSLRRDILDMIVKHMLKLDVRISREALSNACAEEENDDDDDVEDEDIFSMEVSCDDKPEPPKAKTCDKLAQLLPQAVALDALMTIMLRYIKDTCFPGGVMDWTETKKLYRELLSSFDKYIFPTYLSNHTQFVIFYICSFKEALVDGFIDYLWKKVTDPMTQPIYRQIAACYIGSFLARANYIPLSTGQTVMKLMMRWVHDYLDQTCDVNTPADVGHHAAFHSVCQTCFYIFCFRHTQFIHMKNGHKWLEALNFQRVVTSKLNPLKLCLPIIVKTFSSATRTHQLAFCDTIIERNNRYNLPVSSTDCLGNPAAKSLHSFFPFDPYLLKQSGSLIGPLYKEYHGILPDDDVLENEDEDDFLPDEDVHLKSNGLFSMSEGKNSVDFLHYSVSPGFQHAENMLCTSPS